MLNMRDYYITVWETESKRPIATDYWTQGQNALDAFECAVTRGSIQLPSDVECTVGVKSYSGLVMKFEAALV